MDNRIPASILAYALAFACVIGISTGQVLFKIVASSNGLLIEKIFTVKFIIAISIYIGATLLWLWVLRHLPLMTAYPLMALAFIIVPIMSFYTLDENIGVKEMAGGIIIMIGVMIMSWGKIH